MIRSIFKTVEWTCEREVKFEINYIVSVMVTLKHCLNSNIPPFVMRYNTEINTNSYVKNTKLNANP